MHLPVLKLRYANISLSSCLLILTLCSTILFPGYSVAKGIEKSKRALPDKPHVVKKRKNPRLPPPDISFGIIVDNTTTPFGHELARQVSAKWLLLGHKLPASLTIHERPSPLRGSLIEMSLQQRTIFARRYTTRRTDVDVLARQMVSVIVDRLLADQLNAMSRSPDLAESEL